MKLRYILLAAFVVFVGWNIQQYNQSFDRCEQQLKEVNRNLQTLHNEIFSLQAAMSGAEVDYE